MTEDNKEIEIKIEITDIEGFKNKILSLSPRVEPETFERTIRFDTASGDLEKAGVFTRVRSGFKTVWTVKKKLEESENDDAYFQRQEWETEIDDIEKARNMLKALGFEKEYIMEKYRTKFLLPDIEITIDRLPFGNYAELEGSKEAIDRTAQILGISLSERITTTYWHLNDEHNRKYNLNEESIVFKK